MQCKALVFLVLSIVSVLAVPIPADGASSALAIEESAKVSALAIKRSPKTSGFSLKKSPKISGLTTKKSPKASKPATKPVTQPPKPAPADEPKSAPVADKPKSAPVADKPKSAPVADKPKSAPVEDKPKSNPAADKPTSAPSAPAGRNQPAQANRNQGSRDWEPTPNYDSPAGAYEPNQYPAGRGGAFKQMLGETAQGIVQSALTDAVAPQVNEALTSGFNKVKDLGSWKQTRETFTKNTSQSLWDSNPDPAKYAAAICCSSGYTVQHRTGVVGRSSMELTSKREALKAVYDCFYLATPNTFTPTGDTGYKHLAFQTDDRCTWKDNVLTCVEGPAPAKAPSAVNATSPVDAASPVEAPSQ